MGNTALTAESLRDLLASRCCSCGEGGCDGRLLTRQRGINVPSSSTVFQYDNSNLTLSASFTPSLYRISVPNSSSSRGLIERANPPTTIHHTPLPYLLQESLPRPRRASAPLCCSSLGQARAQKRWSTHFLSSAVCAPEIARFGVQKSQVVAGTRPIGFQLLSQHHAVWPTRPRCLRPSRRRADCLHDVLASSNRSDFSRRV